MLDDKSLTTEAFNSTGVPTLWYNEYGWTKLANLLIINSPPPVGYSYCDPAGPAGKGNSCGSWNDTRTAVHNYDFLLEFFKAYPEFKSNELYLSGESYAGKYVPMLAREIYQHRDENQLNFKGFAVGDGVLGNGDFGNGWNYYYVEFMHGHGQFSDLLYMQIQDVCTMHDLAHNETISNQECKKLLAQADKEVGGYFAYNLHGARFST
jgi:carboxypeptidase C (cathepsin A)